MGNPELPPAKPEGQKETTGRRRGRPQPLPRRGSRKFPSPRASLTGGPRGTRHRPLPHPRSRGHREKQTPLKGFGMDKLLPPSSFGLHQKERAKETGFFFLLTSDLRQKVLAGNEHGRAQGAAPHPDIHLQKVHPTATPFTPLLFLEREIEGNRGNDLPTGRPSRN